MTTVKKSGYERLKRWRAKNRYTVNLRQREYLQSKKKNSTEQRGADATCHPTSSTEINRAGGNVALTVRSPGAAQLYDKIGQLNAPPIQPAGAAKIQELRELIKPENLSRIQTASKPVVYRDDYGRVVTERVWKILEERKERARKSGYVIDEYSQ